MTIALHRVDDRLIHGQVVVGWGQPLDIGFIVLVDENVVLELSVGQQPAPIGERERHARG